MNNEYFLNLVFLNFFTLMPISLFNILLFKKPNVKMRMTMTTKSYQSIIFIHTNITPESFYQLSILILNYF